LLIPGLTVVGEGEQYFSMILKLFKNIVHKSGLVGEHIWKLVVNKGQLVGEHIEKFIDKCGLVGEDIWKNIIHKCGIVGEDIWKIIDKCGSVNEHMLWALLLFLVLLCVIVIILSWVNASNNHRPNNRPVTWLTPWGGGIMPGPYVFGVPRPPIPDQTLPGGPGRPIEPPVKPRPNTPRLPPRV
jgi:hypothetical protein